MRELRRPIVSRHRSARSRIAVLIRATFVRVDRYEHALSQLRPERAFRVTSTILAGAVLDGTPIDWAGAESTADDTSRPVLAELRVLAALADVHRRMPLYDKAVAPTGTGDGAAR